MSGILPLIIIGLGFFFLLSNKGGVRSCGGHHEHGPRPPGRRMWSEGFSEPARETIIDLKKEDYRVISIENTKKG